MPVLSVNRFSHDYPFDPCYGYSLDRLLAVAKPAVLDNFADFWLTKYQAALRVTAEFKVTPCGTHRGFRIYDISYQSTGAVTINGWLLEPETQPVQQCIVVGHGYGGREQPDYHFGIDNTAFLFPCFRGLSRSRCPNVSDQPQFHVLHDIDKPECYILGGCVEDLWLAVSVMLSRYPQTSGNIGYMGISFGGGIGALAVPWDERIRRVHLNIPTFGQQPLRLVLPTVGSAAAVQAYVRAHGHAIDTLALYDAAVAAGFARQPLHIAAALFDPVVAPPGQFAIYNAWGGPKQLLVLDAGHFEYPQQGEQERQLLKQLQTFFSDRPV